MLTMAKFVSNADLLNRANKNTKIILFSAIQYLDFDSLKNLVNDWKQEGAESCCFIMNTRLSENVHSCVADSRVTGNHWVCV